jgi:hypothetical protein
MTCAKRCIWEENRKKGRGYMMGGITCMWLVNALMVMPSSLLSTLPIQPPALIYATIQVDGMVWLSLSARN